MPRKDWEGHSSGPRIIPPSKYERKSRARNRSSNSNLTENAGFDPAYDNDNRDDWRQRAIDNFDRIFGGYGKYNRNHVIERFQSDDMPTGAMRTAALASETELLELASSDGSNYSSGVDPFWYH